MRFFNLVAILGVIAVSAEVDDEATGNLRGLQDFGFGDFGDPEGMGGGGGFGGGGSGSGSGSGSKLTMKSFSFSTYKSSGDEDICFDARSFCTDYVRGHLFTAASGTLAYSLEYLYIETQCVALAGALAKTFWCVHSNVEVDMIVNEDTYGGGVRASLEAKLTASTMTLSLAKTRAIAATYATGKTYSFTSLNEFCDGAGKHSLLCAGSSTGVSSLGTAEASSFADALSVAGSGNYIYNRAFVDAAASDISYLGAVIMTYAMSWSFAEAEATAGAMAGAFVEIHNQSYNRICKKTFRKKCRKDQFKGSKMCLMPREEACDQARAIGSGHGEAFAFAYARAHAAAVAYTKICLSLVVYVWKRNDEIWITFGDSQEDTVSDAAVSTAFCPGYRYGDADDV